MNKALFYDKYMRIFRKNQLSKFATDELCDAFFELTEIMLGVNAEMNLTTITDLDGILLKHYADSLTVAKHIPRSARVIDVGCGGGFPSLPLAIAREDISLVSIDSTAKKINYIANTAKALGISNICPMSARAEDLAAEPEYREKFDVAVGRAVARLNILSELCIPFVKVGGAFVAMKAQKADEELAEALAGISKLSARHKLTEDLCLVGDDEFARNEERHLIIIEKIEKTKEIYPRNYSQIKKKPL